LGGFAVRHRRTDPRTRKLPVALASASRAHRFFRPAHHEIDIPTPTPGANQPLAPFEDWGIKVVPLGKLGGIGFDLMIAFPDTTR